MSDRSPQNQDKFVLRLPDGMRDRLKRLAENNRRSMNAEIVTALDIWLEEAEYRDELEADFAKNPLEQFPEDDLGDRFVDVGPNVLASPEYVEWLIQRTTKSATDTIRREMSKMLKPDDTP